MLCYLIRVCVYMHMHMRMYTRVCKNIHVCKPLHAVVPVRVGVTPSTAGILRMERTEVVRLGGECRYLLASRCLHHTTYCSHSLLQWSSMLSYANLIFIVNI